MSMAEASRSVRDSLTVEHQGLRALYRRDSIVIVVAPAVGFVGALGWALVYGIGALDVVLAAGMYTAVVTGLELGFHRLFAHRAYAAHRYLEAVLAVCGSMAAQGRLVRWASNHRRHHGYSDRRGDPHSPHAAGSGESGSRAGLAARFWHAHMGWIFSHEPTNAIRFSKDILRDPMLAWINRYYILWLGVAVAIPAVVAAGVRGSAMGLLEGALFGWAVPIFASQQAAFFVNSLGHWMGRQPFATGDGSRNSLLLAIPSFGAGWQNNHHAFPSSAQLSVQWWEIDIGHFLLVLLEKVGFVWNVKRLPETTTASATGRER